MLPDNRLKNKAPKTSKKLSVREKRFLQEYHVDYDVVRAYMSVFGTDNGHVARSLGYRILANDIAIKYLDELNRLRLRRLHVDSGLVLLKILEILNADYTKGTQYLTEREVSKLSETERRLIQSIDYEKRTDRKEYRDGLEIETDTVKLKVTWMSKDKALEMLARYTGGFAKDDEKERDSDKLSFTDAIKKLNEKLKK